MQMLPKRRVQQMRRRVMGGRPPPQPGVDLRHHPVACGQGGAGREAEDGEAVGDPHAVDDVPPVLAPLEPPNIGYLPSTRSIER